MRALIQRVRRASVAVDGVVSGAIENGMLVLLGVRSGDAPEDAVYLASRTAALRIFNDAGGKMNLSVQDVGGSVLVVSQFTLHADTRKGNRPSYIMAAEPALAERLYEEYIRELRLALGSERVSAGVFRAMMQVELVNDGPVTIMLHSKSEFEGPGEMNAIAQ
jgi:D-tyrosyl-tRNA(Tyr) deacylase